MAQRCASNRAASICLRAASSRLRRRFVQTHCQRAAPARLRPYLPFLNMNTVFDNSRLAADLAASTPDNPDPLSYIGCRSGSFLWRVPSLPLGTHDVHAPAPLGKEQVKRSRDAATPPASVAIGAVTSSIAQPWRWTWRTLRGRWCGCKKRCAHGIAIARSPRDVRLIVRQSRRRRASAPADGRLPH